jgi:hypothetical protein
MIELLDGNEIYSYNGIVTGRNGIGFFTKYHYSDGKQDTLRNFYNSFYYAVQNYCDKTKKIIGILTTSYPKNSVPIFPKILYDRQLIMINSNGSNERIIRIPK